MEAHPYQDLPHLKHCSEWVIAFTPYRGQNRFKKWLLSPAFGHVWAFTEIQGESLMFDPFLGGYFTAVTKPTPEGPTVGSGLGMTPAILASALHKKGQIQMLYYKTRLPQTKPHLTHCLPTCVTMLKLLLGVRAWALTPRQLYRHLLKKGAVPLTPQMIESLLAADRERRSQALSNLV